jgi:CHAT domain-containing protein/tetratricopeptide (TPR) repeat protein
MSFDQNGMLEEFEKISELFYSRNWADTIQHCDEFVTKYADAILPDLVPFLKLWVAASTQYDERQPAAARYEAAIQIYKEAISLAQEIGSSAEPALEINLASAFRRRPQGVAAENIEEALKHAKRALQLHENSMDDDWAIAHNDIGIIYSCRESGEANDNREKAIFHYREALRVRTLDNDPDGWADTTNNLGRLLLTRKGAIGDESIEQGIACLQSSLRYFRESGDLLNAATCEKNLGDALLHKVRGDRAENIESAIEYVQSATERYRKLKAKEEFLNSSVKLAMLYNRRLNGDKAANLEKALEIFSNVIGLFDRASNSTQWAGACLDFGLILMDRVLGSREENLKHAIHHFLSAMEVFMEVRDQENCSKACHNTMLCYQQIARTSENIDDLRTALEFGGKALGLRSDDDTLGRGLILSSLAMLHYQFATHGYEEGINNSEKCFAEALRLVDAEAYPIEHIRIRNNQAVALSAFGKWPEVHQALSGAIESAEILMNDAYSPQGRVTQSRESDHFYVYDAYCLTRMQEYEQALLVLERGKARLLFEAMVRAQRELDAVPVEVRGEVEALQRRVRDLEAEAWAPGTIPGRRSNRSIAIELREARARLREIVDPLGGVQGCTAAQLLAPIGADVHIVLPFACDAGGGAFVVSGGLAGIDARHFVELPEFDTEVVRSLIGLNSNSDVPGWLSSFGDLRTAPLRWREEIESIGAKLWKAIFAPVIGRVRELANGGCRDLVIIPQGGLGVLPLHASWRDEGGSKVFLLDEYCVRIAPSIAALGISASRAALRQREDARVLLVADAEDDLPFAALEGISVASRFDIDVSMVLRGAAATAEAVLDRLAGKTHIHLACHGTYVPENPMLSAFALARGSSVSVREIQRLANFSSNRLIVLSACESGVTDAREVPDEFLGFPGVLIGAGAAAVVCSLWPVSDAATMLLMDKFYEMHLDKGVEPAGALRHAQRWLREQSAGGIASRYRALMKNVERNDPAILAALDEELARMASLGSTDFPFQHPYYWAGFTLVGY